MPQVTLSVPKEKLPLLQDFIQALGIDDKSIKKYISDPLSDLKRSAGNLPNSFFSNFSWEYNCNELEFE